ncbi:conserved hypothetical protein [Altererythrobacter sp. B11]|uniref:hypothetical protein n=1 Tax=Altererythrobacter sp. B11 TaxID=2060312 RepID=UPI000DC70B92|nr:hypothetical protein [Altererythrobacter sp. B11]BBC73730.1 conserved hypothetical protein [Altererythrobacter sp. B11]
MRLTKMLRLAHPMMLSVALGLVACHGQQGGEAGAGLATSTETEGPSTPLPMGPAGHGMIGPVAYTFDDEELTRTEVQLPVPPRYRDEVWAVKLIPRERAELLGQVACRYGDSARDEVCTVEDEAGLALAMLERPIADYRKNFADSGFGEEQLGSVEIGGRIGFRYTASGENGGVEYNFLPVAGRTLMIARKTEPDAAAANNAIGAVVAGLRLED